MCLITKILLKTELWKLKTQQNYGGAKQNSSYGSHHFRVISYGNQ